MRCKKCGIELTANTLDNCPNCGVPEENADIPWFFRPWSLALFGLTSVAIAGGLVFAATGMPQLTLLAMAVTAIVGASLFFSL